MKKSFSKKIAFITILIAAGVFSYVFIRSVLIHPEAEAEVSVSTTTVPVQIGMTSIPDRLVIPAISVQAKVQEVGITKKGNMGVPNNFTDVGWYKYGSLPGQKGNAVIAGHVDNGLALPGVFKRLEDLRPGDDIYIVSKDGTQVHFKVTTSVLYDKNAGTEEIFNRNGSPQLRLITCAGTWIPAERTRDKRLVVTATLAS